jgi:hypothetical protein
MPSFLRVVLDCLVLMNKFPLDMDIVLNKFFEIRLRKVWFRWIRENADVNMQLSTTGKYILFAVAGAVSLAGLYVLSRVNYLLFHSSVEVFSIVIAFAIFAIAWNSRRMMDSNYLLFIGIACLFVGGVDLLHTLA